MIPKKIHYCWFGGKPLPQSAQRCIASWRKFLPDFEIIEWNEENFNVNSIPYTAEAYAAGKYAFVSDYARFKILYEHGGVYFDTDVEIVRDMDPIIMAGPFLGVETGLCKQRGYRQSTLTYVNPGLGMGAEAGMHFYQKIIDVYTTLPFLKDGRINDTAVVKIVTRHLRESGLRHSPDLQVLDGITIYPMDYFNPWDDILGKLQISPNTVSIHWYDKSWMPQRHPAIELALRIYHRIFGATFTSRIKHLLGKQ